MYEEINEFRRSYHFLAAALELGVDFLKFQFYRAYRHYFHLINNSRKLLKANVHICYLAYQGRKWISQLMGHRRIN